LAEADPTHAAQRAARSRCGQRLSVWFLEKTKKTATSRNNSNYSFSKQYILRGLHYQMEQTQGKLVRVTQGRVFDVAVDLRQNSPTFLRWHAEELTPANIRMMVIPEGFAHGFQIMEPDTELLYLHTAFFTPYAEWGLRYDDPELGITWPLTVTDLSGRDANHPRIDSNFQGLNP
jgi:dTDP-4-dehydrorhamnose 3,5-epimerase